MMLPDAHDRWSQLLPLYVNGRLEGEEREQLARHLADCSRCQDELAEWRAIAHLASQPHPVERHLLAPEVALTNLHHRLTSRDDAPAKGSIMQPSIPPSTPSSSPPERQRGIAAIAIVALLAVFVVTGFAVFRTHGTGIVQRPSTPNAAATTKPNTPTVAPIAVPACSITSVVMGNGGHFQATTGQSVTVHGITMTLEKFYMDYTRTLVLMNVQTPLSQPAPYGPKDFSLVPAAGNAVSFMMGGEVLKDTAAGMRNWQYFALLAPLPVGKLGSQQTVTLRVQKMQLEEGNLSQSLTGPWQLHVTFTTVKPHALEDLSCAPQTYHGISIQPLTVGQAPAPSQFDGFPGGIKLSLCFIGANDGSFDENYTTANYGAMSSGGAVSPPQTEALLTLPNGQQVTPQWEDAPHASCQIGGKTGTLYKLTYLAVPSTLTGKVIFTVPAIIAYDGKTPPIPGPWTFSFDLK